MKPTVTNAKALIATTARSLTAAIMPWPSKAERQAAIEAAQQARQDAEAQLAHTRQVIAENSRAVAAAIADALARSGERGHAGTPSGGAR